MEVELRLPFPSVIDSFLKACSLNSMRVVHYGGAITDFLLNKTPRDYDFYIFSTKERFSQTVLPELNSELNQYENFILPHKDVCYLIWGREVKADLCFVPPGDFIDVEHFFRKYHINWAGGITINSMLYFPEEHKLFDPRGGLKDLRIKVIRTDSDLSIDGEYFEKLCRIYLSGLFGKYEEFSLDAKIFEKILLYNRLHPEPGRYLSQFPWRVDTTLVKVLTYPLNGILRTLTYWDAAEMRSLFLPGMEERSLEEINVALRAADNDPLVFYEVLDALSGGVLEARLKKCQIPQTYLDSMDFEMKPILEMRAKGAA